MVVSESEDCGEGWSCEKKIGKLGWGPVSEKTDIPIFGLDVGVYEWQRTTAPFWFIFWLTDAEEGIC